MSFVHLHVHTSYSLLDASGKIPEMVRTAKNLGQNAMAITDHGVMYGCIEFYEECLKQGIKPIIGCEVYVSPTSRFDREEVKCEENYYHLILLAKNNLGYQNLIKIVSAGFMDGYHCKPRVDHEVLKKYHDGLICSSACIAGEIPQYIIDNKYEEACKTAKKMQEIFGKDNFYIELQDHGYEDEKKVNISLVRMSKELGISLIATNDVHYRLEFDDEAHDVLVCMQTGKKVADEDRKRYKGGQFYIKSEKEMRDLFPYALEAIDNTQKIADQCNVELLFTSKTKKYHFPGFDTPNAESSNEYLKQLADEGLKKRYVHIDKKLEDRLNFELETIINNGFADYFLIVQDYVNYAKSKGIPVGPGRGSATGSLVTYTLGITDVDPIKYGLLFERFLNPKRVTMPDIDVDFCEARRGEVIEYVTKKYGETNVSQIVTFATLKPKTVFKDVARVLDISNSTANIISKLIPSMYEGKANAVTYDILLYGDISKFDINDQPKVIVLREIYNNESSIRKAMNLCKNLEGIPRHVSMHPSGILIAPSSIDDYVSLVRLNDNKGSSTVVAGENRANIERLGFLIMDFLGLRNLTAINEAKKIIKNKYNIDIDFSNNEYNDKKIFDMISKGETAEVFQLESDGMTNFMKELKPECIEDIIAGVSLFRPGSIDFIPKYIERKKNRDNIKYECPQLKQILEATYGCIVYQEQIMQILSVLAGYSLGEADIVRRAMSKKQYDVIERERKAFVFGDVDRGIKGCVQNGIKENDANKIFDKILEFSPYAFNKSHATAMALLIYQTAFLKYYYEDDVSCALCNSDIGVRK